MVQFNLAGKNRKQFQAINDVVHDLLPSWDYKYGPASCGWAEGDRSREHWIHQFIDARGNEVLLYDFQRENGRYTGIIKINLPPNRYSELIKATDSILSKISPEYTVQRQA